MRDAERLTAEAVRSLSRGDRAAFRNFVAELVAGPDERGWTLTADRCLSARLREAVAAAWERGWEMNRDRKSVV